VKTGRHLVLIDVKAGRLLVLTDFRVCRFMQKFVESPNK